MSHIHVFALQDPTTYDHFLVVLSIHAIVTINVDSCGRLSMKFLLHEYLSPKIPKAL